MCTTAFSSNFYMNSEELEQDIGDEYTVDCDTRFNYKDFKMLKYVSDINQIFQFRQLLGTGSYGEVKEA